MAQPGPNAACSAALAARESGLSVIMLEAAPIDDCGGNSRYTAGAVRVVFNGVDDLVQLYDLTEDEKKNLRWEAEQFRAGRAWRPRARRRRTGCICTTLPIPMRLLRCRCARAMASA